MITPIDNPHAIRGDAIPPHAVALPGAPAGLDLFDGDGLGRHTREGVGARREEGVEPTGVI